MQPATVIYQVWLSAVQRIGVDRLYQGLTWVCGTSFVVFVVGLLLLSMAMPEFSFDLVAYIASALQQSGMDLGQAHDQAWGTARAMVSALEYEALSQGDSYRLRQSSDASSFASILPLYQVKVGYIALLNLAPSPQSMATIAYWANYIAGLTIGVLSLIWMARSKTLLAAPAIAALLLVTHYFENIRAPGPDILASALILGGILFWMVKRDWAASLLWLVAFLFRPDTLLLLLAAIIGNLLFRQRQLPALLTFIVALVLSVTIQKMMNHPGWWIHYWFSTVSLQPTLVGFDPAFSLFAWVKGQARGVYMSLFEFNWLATFIVLGSLTTWISCLGFKFTSRQCAALAIFAMTIMGKFILFPLPDDRLYSIYLLAAALVLAEVCANKITSQLS